MAHMIFTGNLGKDPELRHTQEGRAWCTFSLAWSERTKDKTGQWVEGPTQWVNLRAYGKLAERISTTLHKGDNVLVECDQVRFEEWQSDRGATQVMTGMVQNIGATCLWQDITVARTSPGGPNTFANDPWNAPAPAGGFGDDNAEPPF